jgi:DNA polymerase-3 subunit beta
LDKNENENKLIAVATDGHRLSKSATEIKKVENFHPVILPKKTVFELLTIIDEDSIDIKILSTKSKIKFLYKDIVLISKVIDGKFPDYEKVIPKDERVAAKSNVEEFISALDRLKSLSSDRKGVIKISLDKGIMKFLINDAISGDGIEEVQTQYEGTQLEIGFNSGYLIDVANVLESKEIVLMLKDATSPIHIKDLNDPLSTYIVMPMRVI